MVCLNFDGIVATWLITPVFPGLAAPTVGLHFVIPLWPDEGKPWSTV